MARNAAAIVDPGKEDYASVDDGMLSVRLYAWNPDTLAFVALTASSDPTSQKVAVTNFPATYTIVGKTSDSTTQSPRIDATTHTLQTIEYAHHEIHGGSAFTACDTRDIGNGANYDILIVTPNTGSRAHFVYEIAAEAEVEISLFEGATTSADGTSLPAFNRNRESAATAGVTTFHTPTVTATGTKIRCWHEGAGKTFGGGDRGTHEFILARNTKYLLRINNQTTGNNYMAVKLDWYEHTDRTA